MLHYDINHTCWATQQVTYFSRSLLRRSFCGGVNALNESDPFFVATLSTLPFNTARFKFHNICLIRQKTRSTYYYWVWEVEEVREEQNRQRHSLHQPCEIRCIELNWSSLSCSRHAQLFASAPIPPYTPIVSVLWHWFSKGNVLQKGNIPLGKKGYSAIYCQIQLFDCVFPLWRSQCNFQLKFKVQCQFSTFLSSTIV